MTNEQKAQQLRLAAEIIETGAEWEVNTRPIDTHWGEPQNSIEWYASRPDLWMIRIKPSLFPDPPEGGMDLGTQPDVQTFTVMPKPSVFPDPPEGQQWWNPENLTPEQVGVKEGFRLLLADEDKAASKDQANTGTNYSPEWTPGFGPDKDSGITYRTRRPLPEPPVLTLPPLHEGQRYHGPSAKAITQEHLRAGYRPMLLGEAPVVGDKWIVLGRDELKDIKVTDGHWVIHPNWDNSYFTKRPLPEPVKPAPELPPLPDGRRRHRPEAITPEMRAEGWRPLMIGEDKPPGYQTRFEGEWQRGQNEGCEVQAHQLPMRTKAPMPVPVEHVALEPKDILPGSVIITSHGNPDQWMPVRPHAGDAKKAVLLYTKEVTYQDLMDEGYRINRSIPETGKWNPEAWQPCRKVKP